MKFQVADSTRPPARHSREPSRRRGKRPAYGAYLGAMSAAQEPLPRELSAVRFGWFVTRVLDAAKSRGMTMREVEERTGLGKSTMYRWRDGQVIPKTAEVRRFCEGLGAPISEAYAALGWSETESPKPAHPEPLLTDPDVRALMRKLSSPNTPALEKLWIRRQIRALAGTMEDAGDQ